MTRTIPILLAILILLSGCAGDPFGTAAAAQAKAQADTQIAQVQADAAIQTARIDASTARIRVGGWMTVAALALLAVVVVSVVAGATIVRVNADRVYADGTRTLPPVTRATPLPSGRPPSRRPAITQRHTLALPARSEHEAEVIVIEG